MINVLQKHQVMLGELAQCAKNATTLCVAAFFWKQNRECRLRERQTSVFAQQRR